jgi:hypothetical protein
MKYALLFIMFSPLSYSNEPVKLTDFIDGCNLNAESTKSCETYMFGFMNAFLLSKEQPNTCNVPTSPEILLNKLILALESNVLSGSGYYDAEIYKYLDKSCSGETP